MAVGIATLVLPFALGFAFGTSTAPSCRRHAGPPSPPCSSATAFSITALPILGRIMIEFGITRSALGVIAISRRR